ncbi:hypothetical protein J32TS6_26860 [Virgibacillus pantothenticus]|uniref:MerR family transcriptional regulator n=1 Tax=Virgibacillus pantothenticus TaxID=1473 RepID=UPI000956EFE6|nr:MerR family transcriptional regulator [Virgibacillus pantothenticus]GIP64131.1 hypothetical protein J32TS6_26860 [Virgibacillus pantothenticus]SIS90707.1 MerR HTH family regulatory protein [Virgibacillus pantothenticus]
MLFDQLHITLPKKVVTLVELLSLQGLSHIVGVPPSILTTWVKQFAMYVPKVQEEEGNFYLPEAIDVLKYIKQCKKERYSCTEIENLLVTEYAVLDKQNLENKADPAVHQVDDKETIRCMMQTIGLTVSNINQLSESFHALEHKYREQTRELNKLKKQLELLHSKQIH